MTNILASTTTADETAGIHPVLADILGEAEPDTLCWVKA